MKDYSKIGLDSKLRRARSIASRKRPSVGGFDFNANYQVESTFLRASRLQVTKFVRYSGSGTVVGTIPDNTSVTISSLLTAGGNPRKLGMDYISVYEGTSTGENNQIFPRRGSNIDNTEYSILPGYDKRHWSLGTPNKHAYVLENNSGVEKVINFTSRWMYIQEDAGTSTI